MVGTDDDSRGDKKPHSHGHHSAKCTVKNESVSRDMRCRKNKGGQKKNQAPGPLGLTITTRFTPMS